MKKILLFMFIIFSLNFSDSTYKVSYEKSFTQSKQDEDKNNIEIENFIKTHVTRESFAKLTGIENKENTNDDSNARTSIYKAFIDNTKFVMTNIHYIDSDKATVTVDILIPIFNGSDSYILADLIKTKFKKITNLDLDSVNFDELEDYNKIYEKVVLESYIEYLNQNTNFSKQTTTFKITKTNGKWIFEN